MNEVCIEFKSLDEATETFDIIEAMLSSQGIELQDNFIVITLDCPDVELAKNICLKHFGKEHITVEKKKI
jgi:hypothetical protein